MPALAWATDIHLNFLDEAGVDAFGRALADTGADAAVITGDIAEAPSLGRLLTRLGAAFGRPIYFVLGNHDYYFSAIAKVRDEVRALCAANPRLVWLPAVDGVRVADGTILCGHGGWGDARIGNFRGSRVDLSDYHLIADLTGIGVLERERRLNALGDEAAAHAERVVTRALAQVDRVVFATHVPPFRDACWHEGKISDDDWLPHFTCQAVGDALVRVMRAHPDRELLVLCGHTHGAGEARILPNLRVVTGGAEYGDPRVADVITVA